MIQPTTLTEQKAAGDKKNITYRLLCRSLGFVTAADVRKWTIDFLQYWRSSVGWILCWDDADADDYVADVSKVMLVLTAGLYWCRVWNWHIFPQLSLIIAALCRSFEELLISVLTVSNRYIQHARPQALCDLTLSNVLPLHRTAPWTKLTKCTPTDQFVPSNLRLTQYGNQFWFSLFYVT